MKRKIHDETALNRKVEPISPSQFVPITRESCARQCNEAGATAAQLARDETVANGEILYSAVDELLDSSNEFN